MTEENVSKPGETTEVVSSPPIDPEQYNALVNYVRENEAWKQQLAPRQAQIDKLLTDPDYADFIDQSYPGYTTAKERARDGQLPPESKLLLSEFKKEVAPALEFVETSKKMLKAQSDAEAQRIYQANLDFGNRLAAENPHLKENNWSGMQRVAKYAAANGLSLEDGWKDLSGGIAQVKSSPPTSLRADSGTGGVPGKSQEQAPKTREEFVAQLSRKAAKAMRDQRGA
jgi:hypothetical protein